MHGLDFGSSRERPWRVQERCKCSSQVVNSPEAAVSTDHCRQFIINLSPGKVDAAVDRDEGTLGGLEEDLIIDADLCAVSRDAPNGAVVNV